MTDADDSVALLMTPAQAAQYLGISVAQVRRMIANTPGFPAFQPSPSRWLISLPALRKWLRQQCVVRKPLPNVIPFSREEDL